MIISIQIYPTPVYHATDKESANLHKQKIDPWKLTPENK